MLMNASQTTHVMSMQSVMILMVATGVSAGQDSWEMDTTALVSFAQCSSSLGDKDTLVMYGMCIFPLSKS